MEPRDGGRDRLDQWLDQALHEYGSAEPRMGLEGRVLANLAAERTRIGARRRWWVLGAAAMVCMGMVVWVGGMSHRSSAGSIAGNTTPVGQRNGTPSGLAEVKRPVVEAVPRRTRPRAAKVIEVSHEPRLSQFPSARGLSEQEQLLIRYVTESPSEAVLVAKEQRDWRQAVIDSDNSSDTQSGNSNQEER